MSGVEFLRIALMPLCGVILWTFFRKLHRGRGVETYAIRVPPWLSLLCGRPLANNRVDLPSMLGQLGSFLLCLVWIPVILGVDAQLLVWIYSSVFMATILTAFTARIVTMAINRQGKRGVDK